MKQLFISTVALMCIMAFSDLYAQQQDVTLSVDSLHRTFVSIDTHNDAAMWILNPEGRATRPRQVSFPMMRQGLVDVAFFAAYIGQGPRTSEGHQKAFETVNAMLAALKDYVAERSDEAAIAYTPEDMHRIKAQGKSAMVLAIENGYCLDKDITRLQHFADLGVKAITLCHNRNNEVCDSSQDTLEHGGLSAFGRELIKEMNRLGIMIDVSHASKETTLQACALSEQPIIATHSGVYALKNFTRNISDEEIIAIAKKGGVIQVAIGGFFLSDLPRSEVTVKDIVNHIDYVVNLVGIDHVGVGSDFDGGAGVTDCNSMAEMKNITAELLHRGYNAEQIAKIWGENTMRMMEVVQNLLVLNN